MMNLDYALPLETKLVGLLVWFGAHAIAELFKWNARRVPRRPLNETLGIGLGIVLGICLGNVSVFVCN